MTVSCDGFLKNYGARRVSILTGDFGGKSFFFAVQFPKTEAQEWRQPDDEGHRSQLSPDAIASSPPDCGKNESTHYAGNLCCKAVWK